MTVTDPIFFITGNSGKVREIQTLLPQVEQLQIDLPEIQSIDPRVVVQAKLQAAFEHHEGPFMVEDTSMVIDGLNGLPGPFVKWFEQALSLDRLVTLARAMGDGTAEVMTLIGYASGRDQVRFFEGRLAGTLVKPTGNQGFGWDPIFQPAGYQKTLAQLGEAEKNRISYRRQAVDQLRAALQ